MLFLIFLLIFSSKVEATDFSIRCAENKCDSFSENIFYQGQNLYPGLVRSFFWTPDQGEYQGKATMSLVRKEITLLQK